MIKKEYAITWKKNETRTKATYALLLQTQYSIARDTLLPWIHVTSLEGVVWNGNA